MFRTLKNIRLGLNLLLVVALVLYVSIKFWLQFVPNYWGISSAPQWGEFFSDISVAYITSWMFFVVTDQWDRSKRQRQLHPIVLARVSSVLLDAKHLERLWQLSFRSHRCPNRPKALMDYTREELSQTLVNLYMAERDAGKEEKRFTTFIKAFYRTAHNTQPKLENIASSFGDLDSDLISTVEMMLYSLPQKDREAALTEYEEQEEVMRASTRFKAWHDEIELRKGSDVYQVTEIHFLSGSIALYIGCAVSLARWAEAQNSKNGNSFDTILAPLVKQFKRASEPT